MKYLRRGLSGIFYSVPQAPVSPSPPISGRAPVVNGNAGRRMTYEEAVAQQMIEMNQTVAQTNHLSPDSEIVPGTIPPETLLRQVEESERARQPFTYMGIQGQAPAQILLPAIAATQTVVSFTCPRRLRGKIEFIANQFVGGGWVEGTGSIIWQILIDSVPVQGYDSILGSLGSTASPGWLGSGAIQFSDNQLVQLRCRNVSIGVAGQVLLGLLRGYFWPVDTPTPSEW